MSLLFQFLIGRLGTNMAMIDMADNAKFQFLIGRLGTRQEGGLYLGYPSFNSL